MTLLRQISNFSIFVLSAIFLATCGITNPVPTVTTMVETATKSTTFTSISPTLVIPQLTPSSISTPTSSVSSKIRLYHNHVATRTTRDKYSFSVVVMNQATDLTPRSIHILEQGTGAVIGQYELLDQTEIASLCASSFQNPDFAIYETVLIDYFDLPQGFIIRAYEGDFIFQITIEHASGLQEIVERQTPARSCYQAVS
jgi:hypothetical protein